MMHDIKCWPYYFQATIDGRKLFEFRINDRGYKVGDTLHINEWNPATGLYTGRDATFEVTYILDLAPQVRGYCIIGIRSISLNVEEM